MVVSRVIIRVTSFRALITLLITYLLSPLPLQVGFAVYWFRVQGQGSEVPVVMQVPRPPKGSKK